MYKYNGILFIVQVIIFQLLFLSKLQFQSLALRPKQIWFWMNALKTYGQVENPQYKNQNYAQ